MYMAPTIDGHSCPLPSTLTHLNAHEQQSLERYRLLLSLWGRAGQAICFQQKFLKQTGDLPAAGSTDMRPIKQRFELFCMCELSEIQAQLLWEKESLFPFCISKGDGKEQGDRESGRTGLH